MVDIAFAIFILSNNNSKFVYQIDEQKALQWYYSLIVNLFNRSFVFLYK